MEKDRLSILELRMCSILFLIGTLLQIPWQTLVYKKLDEIDFEEFIGRCST